MISMLKSFSNFLVMGTCHGQGKQPKRRKHNKQDEDEDDDPRNWIHLLPHEVAVDIVSKLSIKSLIQFRFVCRSWHKFSHDPQLVNMHLFRAMINHNFCLVFHCDYPIRNQLHFVELSDSREKETVTKFDTPFASTMPEFSIVGSSNGLLCLVDSLYSDSMYLYNPFTRDCKQLPRTTEFQEQIVIFGFGFHPIINDFKVIKIAYYPKSFDLNNPKRVYRLTTFQERRSEVQVYSLARNTWFSRGEAPYHIRRRSEGVVVRGRLHWLGHTNQKYWRADKIIICFDLADDSFDIIPKPDFGAGIRKLNFQIFALGECLCAAVPARFRGLDIWIMKEYGVKESWVKEYTIGTHYFPEYPKRVIKRPIRIWKNSLGGQTIRVLCVLKSGEILVEYKGGDLVCFDPESGGFRHLEFEGLPTIIQTTVHVGSLCPITPLP